MVHLETGEANRVASPSADVRGVAYHSNGNKMFWYDFDPEASRGDGNKRDFGFKTPYSVYSADLNANGVQRLLSKSILSPCALTRITFKWVRTMSNNKFMLITESNNAFYAIDYDWVTENLYLCRAGGLTVCNTTACDSVTLTYMTDPKGLALDPLNGYHCKLI